MNAEQLAEFIHKEMIDAAREDIAFKDEPEAYRKQIVKLSQAILDKLFEGAMPAQAGLLGDYPDAACLIPQDDAKLAALAVMPPPYNEVWIVPKHQDSPKGSNK